MQPILYNILKKIVASGLFFYTKKITVTGKKNIPKKGAIMFLSNHPNALMDPLLIATSIPRKSHYLVRASVFSSKFLTRFFGWFGMMPVYRIRDGIKQVSKNEEIFNACEKILAQEKTMLLFPEGSHSIRRTIRTISKGFTRILFRTLDNNPELEINIIPVGITYQNITKYPTKIAINIGTPILTTNFYNKEDLVGSVNSLKSEVSNQLKKLSVSITDDENYTEKLLQLNAAQVDFTDVKTVNWMLEKNTIPAKKNPKKEYTLLKFLVILNSIVPYLIWKNVSKKIKETEFVDTFRFGLNLILVPVFFVIQSCIITAFFDRKTAVIYFVASIFLVLVYTKTSPTNTETTLKKAAN